MAEVIYDLTKFTLLDYPGKTAAILWFAGCNMRCNFCYNPKIVFGKGKLSMEEVYSFLEKRKTKLQGVVLSGGECTNNSSIISIASKIKNMGYLIKLDTNGIRPDKIQRLVQENLVDYIALDFKSVPHKFQMITNTNAYDKFVSSLQLLIEKAIPLEVRTTFHSQLHSTKDIIRMSDFLFQSGYRGTYFIQNYINNINVIKDPGVSNNITQQKLNQLNLSLPVKLRTLSG